MTCCHVEKSSLLTFPMIYLELDSDVYISQYYSKEFDTENYPMSIRTRPFLFKHRMRAVKIECHLTHKLTRNRLSN